MDFSGIIAFTISNIVINRGIKFLHHDPSKGIRKIVYTYKYVSLYKSNV